MCFVGGGGTLTSRLPYSHHFLCCIYCLTFTRYIGSICLIFHTCLRLRFPNVDINTGPRRPDPAVYRILCINVWDLSGKSRVSRFWEPQPLLAQGMVRSGQSCVWSLGHSHVFGEILRVCSLWVLYYYSRESLIFTKLYLELFRYCIFFVTVYLARVRGRSWLGWIDGVKVTLGNRGMTVEAASQFAKDWKEWRALVHL